ncbi:hypothetical protein [Methylobacter luteus]|uniref:hypothetical protein n=1 Tax=Methylobacter luteus TaxID=415 RepID=UPI0003F92164|nr:hypothetical protein [Methylobacter luteus]
MKPLAMTRVILTSLCYWLISAGIGYGVEKLDPEAKVNLSGQVSGTSEGGIAYEYTMTSGRLSKVPVSWVFSGMLTVGGNVAGTGCCGRRCTQTGSRLDIRAKCVNVNTAADECDPALFVHKQDFHAREGGRRQKGNESVFFNNDSSVVGERNAYVSLNVCGLTNTADIRVQAYSNIRGTSLVNVEYRLNPTSIQVANDTGWRDDFRTGTTRTSSPGIIPGRNRNVGGTLVKVGPVKALDYLALLSPTASRTTANMAAADARLWVFNPTKNVASLPGSGALTDGNQATFYLGNGWTGGSPGQPSDVFALLSLGETQNSGAGNVEKFYDLVHYPLNEAVASLGTPDAEAVPSREARQNYCSPKVALPAGHHEWQFNVKTSFNVGTYPHWDGIPPPGPNPLAIGTGNDLAFRARVLRNGGIELSRRYVPRGALGVGISQWNPITIWNTIIFDVVVPDEPGSVNQGYSVCFDNIGPHVQLGAWSMVVRNRDTAEIRVATANIEYEDDGDGGNEGTILQTGADLKNLVDYLGRSADYGNSTSVSYKNNRGRWRFDADIINLNEVLHDNIYSQVYGTGASAPRIMTDRLNASSAFINNWNEVVGPSRYCGSIECLDRFGVLYANPRTTPTGASWADGTPIHRYPKITIQNACDAAGLGRQDTHGCRTRDDVYQDDFVFPLRAKANRIDSNSAGGYSGVPIMVFHLYLDSGGWGPGGTATPGTRAQEYENLTEFIVQLLLRDPFGFNSTGNVSTWAFDNRIIILGDSNLLNVQNAEENAFLRLLRRRFGYAIDVAQAVTDRNDDYARTLDGHYSGLPLMSWLDPGQMYDASTGKPPGYSNYSDWVDIPWASRFRLPGPADLGMTTAWHPWWTKSETGYKESQGAGEDRLDAIFLVGLGWAKDDPVRQYAIPPTAELDDMKEEHPMVGRNPDGTIEEGAIDIRRYCSFIDRVTGSKPNSYRPEFSTPCDSGKPESNWTAWRSDHKPIGTRLRIRY